MCGFLVEYNLSTQTDLNKDHFLDLLSLSRKRGPDSSGYMFISPNVQMGFNRLAIQDVSAAGDQPMQSANKKFTIVFNGEIYNHFDLRKRLNYNNFSGHSDTETIVACLEAWGVEKTIKALNGMFAMVIFNHQTLELSLVRDFAGIKPLFYGWDGKALVVASQYDQIRGHALYSSKSINSQVLKLYLEQHFMPAPFGLYEDTFQVLPGEIITFSSEGVKTHQRYWELPVNQSSFITDSSEAEYYIETVLDKVVERQLLSDVPVGAFLSGGVDSTLIGTSIKKYHKNTQLFTIGSDSKIHDESERAQQFAEALDLQQTVWNLDAKEMLSYWDEAMNALHEPMADFSILPTYLVSKLAKKQVSVALSGDGGDELFFGYERFWSVGKNIRFQHYPSLIRKGLYGFDKYASGNKNLNAVLLASSQASAQQGLHSRFRKEWLDALAPQLAAVSLPESYQVYSYENSGDIRTLLQHMRHAEFYGMMQKTLRKVDLASMENSLEVRVPFLDKQMIEASLQIDPLLSYGKNKSKQVLKQVLHKRIPSVPMETVKKGFSIPLSGWLREDLKTLFTERLLDADLTSFGFERHAIEQMLQRHADKKQDFKWPLFTLYALVK
ncbi:asparagine synthase (glutamine-hydrolysing) [Winogradskyella epiphytica]|uniref:asparagine synthase (glutamine-hydrolyzing) n=1 Tax=Winogradskyella epiphytica TaxID=262005 RepID=A0A2V4YF63_9FLAO|nr:asparagine synthase (glutamine-hydrolyzing) [Winogradskyella epiphytica]PYE82137.1 asparagine synthase (glutamine-hydrolysing) [Winogradskyella epiphytica]GGW60294.1 asparagine synthetase B [Winogradskyella epiphytica]